MKKIIILFVFCINTSVYSQDVFSIGPMYHLNIGDKSFKSSFGLEVAYWNKDAFPYSVDFGLDFQKGKFRLYTEAQTGVGFAGVSLGPVIEFKKGSPVQVGLQTSAWANYILGVDFRFRFFKGPDYIAPGLYLKYPWILGNENINNSNSSNNYFDWD